MDSESSIPKEFDEKSRKSNGFYTIEFNNTRCCGGVVGLLIL